MADLLRGLTLSLHVSGIPRPIYGLSYIFMAYLCFFYAGT